MKHRRTEKFKKIADADVEFIASDVQVFKVSKFDASNNKSNVIIIIIVIQARK